MMETDDSALLAAVARGSEQAFNVLVDRHHQALRLFLRGLISNAADADDIAQETLLAMWTHAKSFKGEATVKSWLCSIGWRKAKQSQRLWSRHRLRDAAYHQLLPGEQDRQVTVEDRHMLSQALASLSLDQRAAVMLCLGCGLSHSEAADVLGYPLGTVKSHVMRGREQLRAVLGQES